MAPRGSAEGAPVVGEGRALIVFVFFVGCFPSPPVAKKGFIFLSGRGRGRSGRFPSGSVPFFKCESGKNDGLLFPFVRPFFVFLPGGHPTAAR